MITKIRTSNGSVVFLLGGVHKFGIKDAFYRIGKQADDTGSTVLLREVSTAASRFA